jgi:hypothetical protein
MVNRAKAESRVDGQAFLRRAFEAEQQVLACQLRLSAQSVTHDGTLGEVNEQCFIDVLRRYLPHRYAIDRGIVIDSKGCTSDQIDLVIYDRQYTPTLLDQHAHRFIPAEAVYCVLEVKPTLNKAYLEYAGDKARSVRALARTSVEIVHAGGTYPAKPLSPILAGIVTSDVDWSDGVQSASFESALSGLRGDGTLDIGLALTDRAFDVGPSIEYSGKSSSLAFFVFRLLQRLQALGTVGATDWNQYARVLGQADA